MAYRFAQYSSIKSWGYRTSTEAQSPCTQGQFPQSLVVLYVVLHAKKFHYLEQFLDDIRQQQGHRQHFHCSLLKTITNVYNNTITQN